MDIILIPQKGIRIDDVEVLFGMSQDEVNNLIGIPYKVEIDNIMKEVKELRTAFWLVYREGVLAYIIYSKNVRLFINGHEVFNEESIVLKLQSEDSNFEISKTKKYINFYSLGLSLGGFMGKKIPEGRIALSFSRELENFFRFFLKS